MQNIVRTTIRIRKDLLDQSRLLALKKGTSLQDIINSTLAVGFSKISDMSSTQEAMAKIDKFRTSLKGVKVNVDDLLTESKQNLK